MGVTNDLERRVFEHKQRLVSGFTADYDVDRLIYFESTPNVLAAIQREKQIKGWRRDRKVALVESVNPHWEDLSLRWAEQAEISAVSTPALVALCGRSQAHVRRQRSVPSAFGLGMTGGGHPEPPGAPPVVILSRPGHFPLSS